MNRKSFLKTLIGAIATVPFASALQALPYREVPPFKLSRQPFKFADGYIFYTRDEAIEYRDWNNGIVRFFEILTPFATIAFLKEDRDRGILWGTNIENEYEKYIGKDTYLVYWEGIYRDNGPSAMEYRGLYAKYGVNSI